MRKLRCARRRGPSHPSRREFLSEISSAAASISIAADPSAISLLNLLAAPTDNAVTPAADPLRPQFHLLPAANWMNDPNGPIYWRGHYHMFFQYNPNAAVWGDMHWAHAVSQT